MDDGEENWNQKPNPNESHDIERRAIDWIVFGYLNFESQLQLQWQQQLQTYCRLQPCTISHIISNVINCVVDAVERSILLASNWADFCICCAICKAKCSLSLSYTFLCKSWADIHKGSTPKQTKKKRHTTLKWMKDFHMPTTFFVSSFIFVHTKMQFDFLSIFLQMREFH